MDGGDSKRLTQALSIHCLTSLLVRRQFAVLLIFLIFIIIGYNNFHHLAPFLPIATYFGFKAFGIDITKVVQYTDSRVKHLYPEEKQTGKDDVGAIFEYHYEDGSKEVVFNKK